MAKNDIHFLKRNDILWEDQVSKAVEFLDGKIEVCSLRAVVNCYNSYSYINTGIRRNDWSDRELTEYRKKAKNAKKAAITYVKANPLSLIKEIGDLGYPLIKDFFRFIAEQEVYKFINEEVFSQLITDQTIGIILTHNELCRYYDYALTLYLVDNKRIACLLLLDNNSLKHTDRKLFFPSGFDASKQKDCLKWAIEDQCTTAEELSSILRIKNNGLDENAVVTAKKRLRILQHELENNPNVSWISRLYSIQITKGAIEPVKCIFDGDDVSIKYGGYYLLKNIEAGKSFLNYIVPFSFTDSKARMLFAKRNKSVSITEEMIPEFKGCYNLDSIQQLTLPIIVHSLLVYDSFLRSNNLSLEYCLGESFNSFIEKTYGITGFEVRLPSDGSSFFDKCCIMGPAIENVLRLHKCIVNRGEIDIDYLETYRKIEIANLKSLVPNKYCYLSNSSDEYQSLLTMSNLLFSNQTILYREDRNVTCNYELFSNFKCVRDDFESFELPTVNYLLKGDCLMEQEGILVLTKKAIVLKELWDFDYISTYHFEDIDVLAEMVENGCLKTSNTLFPKPEVDIFDFFLRDVFPDGYNIRNNYDHGKWENRTEDICQKDYYMFVFLLACVEVKIIDDFERLKAIRSITEQASKEK